MLFPLPCFATLSRSSTPRKPDSRANSGVISGNPIGVTDSISISPSPMRYRWPSVTWGLVQILTLQVMSPRTTPSRRRLAKTIDSLTDQCGMRLYPAVFSERPSSNQRTEILGAELEKIELFVLCLEISV